MHGTGEQFSQNGTKFSGQLIRMYTTSMGTWAYWVVSVSAVATMVSTIITVMDAYPRVLTPVVYHLFPNRFLGKRNKQKLMWSWLIILLLGSTFLIAFATRSMGSMVSLATTISFLVAPILAWLNTELLLTSTCLLKRSQD